MRILTQKLQKENSDLIHEIKLMSKGANTGQLKRIDSIRNSEKNSKGSKMIDQYKDIIK